MKRREIVSYLVQNGGSATRKELLETFGGPKTKWTDFKKQTLADLLGRRRQYRGKQLSAGPPIIELDDEGVHLVSGWREALEEHRTLGGEKEAAIRQKVDHLRQRAAYRRRDKTKADRAPTEAEMAARQAGRDDAKRKRRKIARLVHAGMRREFATVAVLDADGFVEELHPDDLESAPPVEEVVHPLACECLDCSAPMRRYARLAREEDDPHHPSGRARGVHQGGH